VGIIDDGRIVAAGTPAALKSEVGRPHLEVALADEDRERAAQEICAQLGSLLPSKDGLLLVELPQGAAGVATVVRALDDAGIAVESLELVRPSLDDVFVAKTGYHLEGAEPPTGEQELPQ
jgi:ABC-2 type transport system ATP-binding protein